MLVVRWTVTSVVLSMGRSVVLRSAVDIAFSRHLEDPTLTNSGILLGTILFLLFLLFFLFSARPRLMVAKASTSVLLLPLCSSTNTTTDATARTLRLAVALFPLLVRRCCCCRRRRRLFLVSMSVFLVILVSIVVCSGGPRYICVPTETRKGMGKQPKVERNEKAGPTRQAVR